LIKAVERSINSENILFWSLPADRVLAELHSSADGLSDREAKQRLIKYGANSLK
jgi:P-type Mg2+ transporter